jgi:hypothetical protein
MINVKHNDRLVFPPRWDGLASKILGLALLGTMAVSLMGQASPTPTKIRAVSVEARELLLLDSQAKVGARFVVGDDGGSTIRMFDSAGRVRAVLAVLPDGTSSVNFVDERGSPRVTVGLLQDAPTVMLADQTPKTRMMATVQADGSPRVKLFDSSGVERLTLGLFLQGATPALVMQDAKGTVRTVLGGIPSSPQADMAVVFYNATGALQWSAP